MFSDVHSRFLGFDSQTNHPDINSTWFLAGIALRFFQCEVGMAGQKRFYEMLTSLSAEPVKDITISMYHI